MLHKGVKPFAQFPSDWATEKLINQHAPCARKSAPCVARMASSMRSPRHAYKCLHAAARACDSSNSRAFAHASEGGSFARRVFACGRGKRQAARVVVVGVVI